MEKIKIVHIAQANGGVCEFLKMFTRYSNQDKFEIYLICSNQYKDEIQNFEKYGVNVHFVNMTRSLGIRNLYQMVNIYLLFKKIKPDIIYAHSSIAGALSRIPAKILKISIVYNAHGWAFDMDVCKTKKKLYIAIEKFLSKFTDVIVNISKSDKELAIKNNICSSDKLILINNGIDFKPYDKEVDRNDILTKLRIPKDSFIVGCVARISRQKSPDVFIDMAKKILKEVPNSYFIMVGDGDLKDDIQNHISNSELKNRVIITGWVNNVPDYINCFDIAVLPSRWEGFGLCIVEYFAAKKPVIASNVGGIRNLIQNNYNGILINQLDSKKYADAVLYLKHHNSVAIDMCNKAYNIAKENYDIRNNVFKHEKMFEEILYNKRLK